MASFCKYVTGLSSGSDQDIPFSSVINKPESSNHEQQDFSILGDKMVTSPQSEVPPKIVHHNIDSHVNIQNDDGEIKRRKEIGHSLHMLSRGRSETAKPRSTGVLPRRPRSAFVESRSDSLFRRVFHERADSSGIESNHQAHIAMERLAGDPTVYLGLNVGDS